jgi:hypothetical protein
MQFLFITDQQEHVTPQREWQEDAEIEIMETTHIIKLILSAFAKCFVRKTQSPAELTINVLSLFQTKKQGD